nr:hypothetical protein [Sphingobacterium sp. E70]
MQKGLLTGKQAIVLNTHGKSNEEYSTIGMDKALLLTSDKGIYTYCGFQVTAHFFLIKPIVPPLRLLKYGFLKSQMYILQ